MEIRKFRTAYDLELIPASHEGINLGDLAWDPLFGPPVFSKKGMPNTIFTAFLDAEMVTENEWASMQKESRLTPFMDAQLASRTVHVDVESVSELQHPKIGKIRGEFLTEKLSKFTFRKLQVREMSDRIRIRIDHHLEEMKARKWKVYDGRIRRVFLITELYYGTMQLVLEKEYSAEMDALLQHTKLDASAKTEGSHAVEYEFAHDNVPFAMRLERVRTFNG